MSGKQRRGISFGTIFMLAVTLCVLGAMAVVLPRLRGSTDVAVDTTQVLSALKLADLPELSLNEIPIQDAAGPTAAPQAPQATPAPTLAPELVETPTPKVGGSFTLCVGGSVMVETAVRKSAYFSDVKDYDFTEVLALLAPSMQADMTMVSLENLMVSGAKLNDTVTSEQVAPMLATAGVDAVALGFPGVFDQGLAGVTATINTLQGKGLSVVGAYAQQEARDSAGLMNLGGVKLAVLHYTDALTSTGKKKIKNEDAAYAVPLVDAAAIAEDIARMRQAGAQVVLVSLNWGTDGKTAPTKAQKELAQSIADAGADMIIGTGAEVVQPVVWLERAGGGRTLCAYSLGVLISDSRTNAGVAGLLLQLRLSVDGAGNVTFERTAGTPTYVWRYKQDGQYQYRVLPSNQLPPDGMGDDQITSMTRALKTIQTALGEDTPISLSAE